MDNLLVKFLDKRSTGIVTEKCVTEFVEFLGDHGETQIDQIIKKYSNVVDEDGRIVGGLERLIDARKYLEKAFEKIKNKSKMKTVFSFHLHDNHTQFSTIDDAIYYAAPTFFASRIYFVEYPWKKHEGYLMLENAHSIIEIAGWIEEPNKKNPIWLYLKGIIPKELYQNL